MPDLDSNGTATIGAGLSPTPSSDKMVVFSSERIQTTTSPMGHGINLVAVDRTIEASSVQSSFYGGSVNNGAFVIAGMNDFPMPQTPTTDKMNLSFNEKALRDGIELGPLTSVYDGLLDNPGTSFGVTLVTYYKMKAWRPSTNSWEVWISEYPTTSNPSGLPVQFVTVAAAKRPKQL